MQAVLIWGNQLSIEHHSALKHANKTAPIIMIESPNICKKYKYHKQKLVFVLASMRSYADELRKLGRSVYYLKLEDAEHDSFWACLKDICQQKDIDTLVAMRASDRTPQQKLNQWAKQQGIRLEITPNTLFLTRPADFADWADGRNRLQMEQFYRWQRRRLNILMTQDGKPEGDRWNYDAENRKPLPKDAILPQLDFAKKTDHVKAVMKLVEDRFRDNPGNLETWWLPTNRQQAEVWLKAFLEQRFTEFGAYEDAMKQGETFLYHSAISALLNIGWLHPKDVVQAALKAKDVSLAAREGFIRQVIGWREFMYCLYHYKPDDWIDSNYLKHRKQLENYWWKLSDAPEPPLTDVLSRIKKYGYAHHIERLMVLGNFMLINRYEPRQVHDWFMTMFVDAYEWVMVPNVIGMSQYADGGQDNGSFATKPYISGSNYLQKMGKWWPSTKAAKESSYASLYWEFLDTHRDKLESNYRLRPLYSKRPSHD